MGIFEYGMPEMEDLSGGFLFYEQEVKNGKKDEEDEEIIFLAQNAELEIWFDCGAICERLQSWNESSSVGTVFFKHGSKLIR